MVRLPVLHPPNERLLVHAQSRLALLISSLEDTEQRGGHEGYGDYGEDHGDCRRGHRCNYRSSNGSGKGLVKLSIGVHGKLGKIGCGHVRQEQGGHGKADMQIQPRDAMSCQGRLPITRRFFLIDQ